VSRKKSNAPGVLLLCVTTFPPVFRQIGKREKRESAFIEKKKRRTGAEGEEERQ